MAVVDDKKVQCLKHLTNHTDDSLLMPTLEQLLKESGTSLKDLTHIAAVTGPGGFMSLRVGISLANALSWSLKIPVAGVRLSEVWLARIAPPPSSPNPFSRRAKGNTSVNAITQESAEYYPLPSGEGAPPEAGRVREVWLHSTKKNLLFLRGFGALEKRWPEPIPISIEDAQKQIPTNTSFVGELIAEHRKALPQLQPVQSIKSLEDVLPTFIQSLKFEMKPLEPWYGREG